VVVRLPIVDIGFVGVAVRIRSSRDIDGGSKSVYDPNFTRIVSV
jgi:hypothetical protein